MQDKIHGGFADKKSISDFDEKQLLKGIKTELEHTDDYDLALEIAMDHLTEFPNYYDALEKMESSLENDLDFPLKQNFDYCEYSSRIKKRQNRINFIKKISQVKPDRPGHGDDVLHAVNTAFEDDTEESVPEVNPKELKLNKFTPSINESSSTEDYKIEMENEIYKLIPIKNDEFLIALSNNLSKPDNAFNLVHFLQFGPLNKYNRKTLEYIICYNIIKFNPFLGFKDSLVQRHIKNNIELDVLWHQETLKQNGLKGIFYGHEKNFFLSEPLWIIELFKRLDANDFWQRLFSSEGTWNFLANHALGINDTTNNDYFIPEDEKYFQMMREVIRSKVPNMYWSQVYSSKLYKYFPEESKVVFSKYLDRVGMAAAFELAKFYPELFKKKIISGLLQSPEEIFTVEEELYNLLTNEEKSSVIEKLKGIRAAGFFRYYLENLEKGYSERISQDIVEYFGNKISNSSDDDIKFFFQLPNINKLQLTEQTWKNIYQAVMNFQSLTILNFLASLDKPFTDLVEKYRISNEILLELARVVNTKVLEKYPFLSEQIYAIIKDSAEKTQTSDSSDELYLIGYISSNYFRNKLFEKDPNKNENIKNFIEFESHENFDKVDVNSVVDGFNMLNSNEPIISNKNFKTLLAKLFRPHSHSDTPALRYLTFVASNPITKVQDLTKDTIEFYTHHLVNTNPVAYFFGRPTSYLSFEDWLKRLGVYEDIKDDDGALKELLSAYEKNPKSKKNSTYNPEFDKTYVELFPKFRKDAIKSFAKNFEYDNGVKLKDLNILEPENNDIAEIFINTLAEEHPVFFLADNKYELEQNHVLEQWQNAPQTINIILQLFDRYSNAQKIAVKNLAKRGYVLNSFEKILDNPQLFSEEIALAIENERSTWVWKKEKFKKFILAPENQRYRNILYNKQISEDNLDNLFESVPELKENFKDNFKPNADFMRITNNYSKAIEAYKKSTNDIEVNLPEQIKISKAIYQNEQRPDIFKDFIRYELSNNNTRPTEVMYSINKDLIHAGDGVGHTNVGFSGFTNSWALVSLIGVKPINQKKQPDFDSDPDSPMSFEEKPDERLVLDEMAPKSVLIEQYQSDYPVVLHQLFSNRGDHTENAKLKISELVKQFGDPTLIEAFKNENPDAEYLPIELAPDLVDARAHFDIISKAYPYLAILNAIELSKSLGSDTIYISRDAPSYANIQNKEKGKNLYTVIPQSLDGKLTWLEDAEPLWAIPASSETISKLKTLLQNVTGKDDSYEFNLTPAQNEKEKQRKREEARKKDWNPSDEKLVKLDDIRKKIKSLLPDVEIPNFYNPQQALRFLGQEVQGKAVPKKQYNSMFNEINKELSLLSRAFARKQRLVKIGFILRKIAVSQKTNEELFGVMPTFDWLYDSEIISHKPNVVDEFIELNSNLLSQWNPVKKLGSGAEGEAWLLDDGTVLKIFKTYDADLSTYKNLINEEFSGKYTKNLPKIYDVGLFEVPNELTVARGYVILEYVKTPPVKVKDYSFYNKTHWLDSEKTDYDVNQILRYVIEILTEAFYDFYIKTGGIFNPYEAAKALRENKINKNEASKYMESIAIEKFYNEELEYTAKVLNLKKDWLINLSKSILDSIMMDRRDLHEQNFGYRNEDPIFFDG